jgi:hypothetical protein
MERYSIKMDLKERGHVMGVDHIHVIQGRQIMGFCEHGNEHSGAKKDREFFD